MGIFTALTAAQVHVAITPSDRGGGVVGADHSGAAFVDVSGGGLDPGGNGVKNNTAYAELMAYQRETEALGKIAERLGWDQETMMPRGGGGSARGGDGGDGGGFARPPQLSADRAVVGGCRSGG